jgi:anti-anti-sigma factor
VSTREPAQNGDAPGWVVMTVAGEVDMSRAADLRKMFESEWRRQGPGVIVDFTPVTFMDSTGLGWLVRMESDVVKEGGQLRLVISDGPVRRLLDLSGLGDRFQLYPTVEAAQNGG